MTSLCKPLRIIERETLILHETVLANPEAVTKYTERFSALVHIESAKEWFRKKLRAALINAPALLQQVSRQSSTFPDYANTALSHGEPVYLFDPENQNLLMMEYNFNHIADWFNAMQEVLARQPTNNVERHDRLLTEREFNKIMRYSPEVAVQRADEWFRLMGTRVKGQKEGVEVIMSWPDGFYAVRYTDQNTMMSDGQDLQNCLRSGTYWNSVKNGDMQVYGIRKSNDEAVVGIRVMVSSILKPKAGNLDEPVVVECKGKNNQPASAMYRPYVVGLLNRLKFQAHTADLAAAGILYSNGKFGSFEDISDLVYDENGLKIWKTDKKAVAKIGRYELTVSMQHGGITDIATTGPVSVRIPTPLIIKILNALGLPLTDIGYPALVYNIEALGIVYNYATKQYEPLERAGTVLAEKGQVKVISLGNRFLMLRDNKSFCEAIVNKQLTDASLSRSKNAVLTGTTSSRRMISEIINRTEKVESEYLLLFLNAISLPPTEPVELYLGKSNIAYNGKRYGPLVEVAKLIAQTGNASLYNLGPKNKWVLVGNGNFTILTGDGRLRIAGTIPNYDAAELVRGLIDTQQFKAMNYNIAEQIGVLMLGGDNKMITSIDELFQHIPEIMQDMTVETVTGIPIRIQTILKYFLKYHSRDGDLQKLPRKAERLLLKYMMPIKGRDALMNNEGHERHVSGIEVQHLKMVFPLAAMQVCDCLGVPIPDSFSKVLMVYIKRAMDFITKHPTNLYGLDETQQDRHGLVSYIANKHLKPMMTQEAERAIESLSLAMRANNDALVAMLRDKLKDDSTDISSRFAAFNAMRRAGQDF